MINQPKINRFKLYKSAPELYRACKLFAIALKTILGILQRSNFKPTDNDIQTLLTILEGNLPIIERLVKSIESDEVVK